jgi:hypothetical protein
VLTKAQRIRKFQAERRYAIAHGHDFAKTFAKYRPDQDRDDHGRFADEGKGGAGRGAGGVPKAPKAPGTSGWGVAREVAIQTGLIAAGVAAGPVLTSAWRGAMAGGRAAGRAFSGAFSGAKPLAGTRMTPVTPKPARAPKPTAAQAAAQAERTALIQRTRRARDDLDDVVLPQKYDSYMRERTAFENAQRELSLMGAATSGGRLRPAEFQSAQYRMQDAKVAQLQGRMNRAQLRLQEAQLQRNALDRRLKDLETNKRLAKYRPDQDRDEQGQFADEGKGGDGRGGGSHGGGDSRGGRSHGGRLGTAALAGGTAVAGALGALLLRRQSQLINRAFRMKDARLRRKALEEAAAFAARIERWTTPKSRLGRAVEQGARRAGSAIDRQIQRLPPKVRQALKPGVNTDPPGIGSLIEALAVFGRGGH